MFLRQEGQDMVPGHRARVASSRRLRALQWGMGVHGSVPEEEEQT